MQMDSTLVSVTSSSLAARLLFSTLALMVIAMGPVHAKGVYQTDEAFLDEVFSGAVPEPSMLWLTGGLKTEIESILSHPYARLRVRYWLSDDKTAWILEEIGKERPITLGFEVSGSQIVDARVLAFRESRGWEIRHPSFTRQFDGVARGKKKGLNRTIDGITGATLSVRAFTRLAAMALTLNDHVQQQK